MKDQWNIQGVLNIQDQHLQDQLEIASEILLSEIKYFTPVDEGNLLSKNQKEIIDNKQIRVFNNAIYAIQREFGGVITAGTGKKKAKYLSIPIHKLSKGKEPGDFDDLFLIKKKDGEMFLAQQTGKTKRSIKFLFVLKESVRQTATPFMRPGLESAWPKIQEAIK